MSRWSMPPTGPGCPCGERAGWRNRVLVAVRMFLSFAVVNRNAPQWVLSVIYELADTRDLPLEAMGENGGLFPSDGRPPPSQGARDRSGSGQ